TGTRPHLRDETLELRAVFIEENAGEPEEMRLFRVIEREMRVRDVCRLCVKGKIHQVSFLGLETKQRIGCPSQVRSQLMLQNLQVCCWCSLGNFHSVAE